VLLCVRGYPWLQDKVKASGTAPVSVGYGADVLRYWVASTDFEGDVCVGATIMAATGEALRKVRNTCRFMLGALHGFSVEVPKASTDPVAALWAATPRALSGSLDSLTPLDR
jgi:isoleucyl-tRNA synthetase